MYIYHFCYGSNLSEFRLKYFCPSAERIGIGQLKYYQFGIGNYFSKRWNGNAATIINNEKSLVWGSIWKIHSNEIKLLDYMEKTHLNIYYVKYLDVNVFNFNLENLNITLNCYTYILHNTELGFYPSKSYLFTIINGAFESRLPISYIKYLCNFKHNNKKANIYLPNNVNIE